MTLSKNPPPRPFEVLKAYLSDPKTSWSVGTFGALAEFFHDPDHPASVIETASMLSMQTPTGAIQISDHKGLRLLPYEGLSSLAGAWSQGVLVCLPKDQAQLNCRHGISEIGPDLDCLDPAAKSEILFDLGLGIDHLDVCIRTPDGKLIERLRKSAGSRLFADDTSVLTSIQEISPTRVFVSSLARIEVYQKIPAAGGETPLGPHTHLSAQLLGRRQSQAATLPVPENQVPVLAFYPPNPVRDPSGVLRPFDSQALADFQFLHETFGPPELVAIKQTFRKAMENQWAPDEIKGPGSKFERTALRVAIRQHHHEHGPSPVLERWRKAFEPTDHS